MNHELIRLENLVMEFNGNRVLNSINLSIEDKKFLTLLGPSGCGKTTTIRIIGGFLTPTSGTVLFDGKPINSVPAYKRQINTVFQNYALFPHLDVYDNIAFGLRISGLSEKEIDSRVGHMLESVSLKGFENRRVPSLSVRPCLRVDRRASSRNAAQARKPFHKESRIAGHSLLQ